MSTLQFVDKIDAAPTLRLNINDQSAFFLYRNPDFSPPPLRRVVVATMLRDGADIPASSYENRVIKLRLRVKGSTKDDLATKLQSLARELDRQNNILKWQSTLATNPVFFRTFRSPDYRLNIGGEGQAGEQLPEAIVDLSIVAEPFAYGIRVTQAPVTVNNDPAAGSNPCYFDVTGVTGDVPTPGFFKMTGTTQQDRPQLLAVRRHGTPGGVYATQCEAMVQGTDTSVQPNDATASGAGNNYSRTTFATVQALGGSARLDFALPAAGDSIEYRGRYRIFARVRRSDAVTVMQAQMRDAAGSYAFAGPIVTLPLQTYWMWIDMGLVSMPLGVDDPVYEGYSNTAQLVTGPSSFVLDAGSASATPDLDWDVVLAVPADEELTIVNWQDGGGNTDRVMDGPNDKCYTRNASVSLPFGEPVTRVGTIPFLAPNQTNRLAMLRNVGGDVTDDKTLTQTVTVSFWPRWLYIRP